MKSRQKQVYLAVGGLMIVGGLLFLGKLFWAVGRPLTVVTESAIPVLDIGKLTKISQELAGRTVLEETVSGDLSKINFGKIDPFKE